MTPTDAAAILRARFACNARIEHEELFEMQVLQRDTHGRREPGSGHPLHLNAEPPAVLEEQ
jgi:hypothetical protein